MSGTTSPILSLRFHFINSPLPASAVLEANLWFTLTWQSHCPPSHCTPFPGPLFTVPPKWPAILNSRPILALSAFTDWFTHFALWHTVIGVCQFSAYPALWLLSVSSVCLPSIVIAVCQLQPTQHCHCSVSICQAGAWCLGQGSTLPNQGWSQTG